MANHSKQAYLEEIRKNLSTGNHVREFYQTFSDLLQEQGGRDGKLGQLLAVGLERENAYERHDAARVTQLDHVVNEM
ncbi:TPA: hypothetical protein HA278_06595, partial [Candidatus Woesearchaeota archaeon]|nr:hypothetical protein [Candidatus Woesearchaeota archaeon]